MGTISRKVYCPVTSKRAFSSKLEAQMSLLDIRDDQAKAKIPVRVYTRPCTHCGFYHTTSRSDDYETSGPLDSKTSQKRKSTISATSKIFAAKQSRI
jgi:hypothetical protein